MTTDRRARILAAIFAVVGVGHFVRPKLFEAIVPGWVPVPTKAAVLGSGVVELACAAGLATEQRWAGPASAALLVSVWPANIQMAVDETTGRRRPLWLAALWARVPLQIPMIRTALAV
jgi:uncharacterized membrane protein